MLNWQVWELASVAVLILCLGYIVAFVWRLDLYIDGGDPGGDNPGPDVRPPPGTDIEDELQEIIRCAQIRDYAGKSVV